MLLLYNLTIWPMTSDNPTKHLTRPVSENMEGRLEDMNLYICLYICLYVHFMYRLRNNLIVTKHIFSAIFSPVLYHLWIKVYNYIWKGKNIYMKKKTGGEVVKFHVTWNLVLPPLHSRKRSTPSVRFDFT